MASGHGCRSMTSCSWQPQSESREKSREDRLSRAIESCHDEDTVLALMESWSENGQLTHLKTDSRGLSALHVAVVCGRYKVLHALLETEAVNINEPSTNAAKKGWTALHFAAILMDLRAIQILLQYQCDTTLGTELQSTPLHFVTGRFGNRGDHLRQYVSTIMRTLIEGGVNPTATNSYGYTVMHESILWCDVTSLSVMLEQNMAGYFKRLLFVGDRVLPHELVWRSTLPLVFKELLEKDYFIQKKMKESTGVIQKITNHDFTIYERLECICNPSPTTVSRQGFPNPESLTARQVGSLLRSASPPFVVEALKHHKSIQEYYHCSSGESRYIFPAYFTNSLPDWACTDCCKCSIVAGRWIEMVERTVTAAENFAFQLMVKLLSRASFSKSHPRVGNSMYFCTEEEILIRIECVDRVRRVGVMIHVCYSNSYTPQIAAKCRNALDFIVNAACELKTHMSLSLLAVVSSKDLKAGKKMPHLFSYTDIAEARASNKTFLTNPGSLNVAETFTDLLLCDPHLQMDPVESSVHKRSYHLPSDVWSKDVCEAAVRDHRDDLTKLMEPDVVANYLISAGVFSSSDREDISSADNKCIRLLDKIEEKGAYQELFSVLHQTGPQLPAHGKLWEILNKSCDEIQSSCSLSSFPGVCLEDHVRPLSPIPEDTATIDLPMSRADTACSGRATEESGYYTHNSASYQSSNRLTQPSFEVFHSKQALSSDVCTSSMSMRGAVGGCGSEAATEHLHERNDDWLERERGIVNGWRERNDEWLQRESFTDSKKISPNVSSPITVPKRNSSSSSLSHLAPLLLEEKQAIHSPKCTAATNHYTQRTTEPLSSAVTAHCERTTQEWGYYTQQSHDPCSSELSDQKHTYSLELLVSMSDGFIPFEIAGGCESEALMGCMQGSKDDQLERDSVKDDQLERDSVTVSAPKTLSPKQVSSPITVPIRNSSSSSLPPLSESAPERPASLSDASPAPSSPKQLSSGRELKRLLMRGLQKLLFPPPDDVQDTYTLLPGIKQMV